MSEKTGWGGEHRAPPLPSHRLPHHPVPSLLPQAPTGKVNRRTPQEAPW